MGTFGIKTNPHHATWQQYLAVWSEIDQLEVFESAWNWDHFYPLAPPYDGPNLEGWTMISALAQATERVRLGAMVNGMHHRHPALTANSAATVDHISGGRFELGMGAGWNAMESDAYGMELGTKKERSDRFEEGMEVIVSLLANKTTNFNGQYYQLTEAWCEPKPVQSKIPIIIGGGGRKRTLRTAARFADQWDYTFPKTTDEWLDLDGVLQAHCEDVGRDHTEIKRSIHQAFDPEMSPGEHRELAEKFFAVGVDCVVWSWRGEMDHKRVAPFAKALAE